MSSVVVVDNEEASLRILMGLARAIADGVAVRAFASPSDALASIGSNPPSLIVLDYVTPSSASDQFILGCRRLPTVEEVPIIVITAANDRDRRYRALDLGATDFLSSPLDGREFRMRARNLLLLGRYQRALSSRASLLEDELAATARQHAEALRERERHLRNIVDSVPALIRVTDTSGRIQFFNTAHERLFDAREGPPPQLQKTLADADYCRRHRRLDLRVAKNREAVLGIEETIVDLRGVQRVLLTTKAPLGSFAGCEQVVTVSVDITERKQIEREIRESEERFRSLIEGSVLGIIIERDGVPIFANRTFARIFGFEGPADVLKLPSIERLFVDRGYNCRRLRTLTENGGVPGPHEFECLREDGTVIWVEMQTQGVLWQGAPALQSTVADVSLRKAYEAPPGKLRSDHRAAQSVPGARPPAQRGGRRLPPSSPWRRAVHRPRPVQEDQRHLGARHRRPAAAHGGRANPSLCAGRRYRRPVRRRRVRSTPSRWSTRSCAPFPIRSCLEPTRRSLLPPSASPSFPMTAAIRRCCCAMPMPRCTGRRSSAAIPFSTSLQP